MASGKRRALAVIFALAASFGCAGRTADGADPGSAGAAYLAQDAVDLGQVQRPGGKAIFERAGFDVAHHQVGLALILAKVVDGHNCQVFQVGDLLVQPFPVPHDAREPCQFTLQAGNRRLGLLTDTGYITPHIVASLGACDALLLECNHDAAMLASGPYSRSLQQRVGGPLGHLSNVQAAGLLAQLDTSRLQHLVAAHLSDKNNQPALARTALAAAMDCEPDWIGIADQEGGMDWRTIA